MKKNHRADPPPRGRDGRPERFARDSEFLMKRCFSVVAASVLAGSGAGTFMGCEQAMALVGLSNEDRKPIDFPEAEALAIKVGEKVTLPLETGDIKYFAYIPGNFWVTVSIESIDPATGAEIRLAASSGAPVNGTIQAAVGDKIVDSLPDQANFLCIQCKSGTPTVVFRVKDSFAAEANSYTDWVNNYSDYSNYSNYSNSYSRYAAYSDYYSNYSNFWSNSW